MSNDFIPANDAAFDNWYKNFVDYVVLKTSGAAPQWKHIPKDRIAMLKASYDRWHAAYLPCLKAHTAIETQTKNAARKEEEKIAWLINNPAASSNRRFGGVCCFGKVFVFEPMVRGYIPFFRPKVPPRERVLGYVPVAYNQKQTNEGPGAV